MESLRSEDRTSFAEEQNVSAKRAIDMPVIVVLHNWTRPRSIFEICTHNFLAAPRNLAGLVGTFPTPRPYTRQQAALTSQNACQSGKHDAIANWRPRPPKALFRPTGNNLISFSASCLLDCCSHCPAPSRLPYPLRTPGRPFSSSRTFSPTPTCLLWWKSLCPAVGKLPDLNPWIRDC